MLVLINEIILLIESIDGYPDKKNTSSRSLCSVQAHSLCSVHALGVDKFQNSSQDRDVARTIPV